MLVQLYLSVRFLSYVCMCVIAETLGGRNVLHAWLSVECIFGKICMLSAFSCLPGQMGIVLEFACNACEFPRHFACLGTYSYAAPYEASAGEATRGGSEMEQMTPIDNAPI